MFKIFESKVICGAKKSFIPDMENMKCVFQSGNQIYNVHIKTWLIPPEKKWAKYLCVQSITLEIWCSLFVFIALAIKYD